MLATRAVAVLIMVAACLPSTLTLDGSTTDTAETTVITSQGCVTGRREVGTCVRRERCDYGTAAVDFTLYRPRGFKLSCLTGDVCCPPPYLVQQDDRARGPELGALDFDDDD